MSGVVNIVTFPVTYFRLVELGVSGEWRNLFLQRSNTLSLGLLFSALPQRSPGRVWCSLRYPNAPTRSRGCSLRYPNALTRSRIQPERYRDISRGTMCSIQHVSGFGLITYQDLMRLAGSQTSSD